MSLEAEAKSEAVTFVDLLAWGLAESPGERFLADPRRWQQLVYKAKQALPEYFRFVYFDQGASEDDLYSDQAEQALHILAQSGLITVGNPSYALISMSVQQRAQAKAHRRPAYEVSRPQVKEVAKLITEVLSAEDDGH